MSKNSDLEAARQAVIDAARHNASVIKNPNLPGYAISAARNWLIETLDHLDAAEKDPTP